jgi:hypothetical protein
MLMRSGHVEKAGAPAKKIGLAIRNYNAAEVSRIDLLSEAGNTWEKIRQLAGHSKNDKLYSSVITADALKEHHAAISTDSH